MNPQGFRLSVILNHIARHERMVTAIKKNYVLAKNYSMCKIQKKPADLTTEEQQPSVEFSLLEDYLPFRSSITAADSSSPTQYALLPNMIASKVTSWKRKSTARNVNSESCEALSSEPTMSSLVDFPKRSRGSRYVSIDRLQQLTRVASRMKDLIRLDDNDSEQIEKQQIAQFILSIDFKLSTMDAASLINTIGLWNNSGDVFEHTVSKLIECEGAFNEIEISSAISGLRHLDEKLYNNTTRRLIQELSVRVDNCYMPFVARTVGNCLYGLQKLSSDRLEVRQLVKSLTVKVSECKQRLSSQSVGNALYGLKKMKSDHEEVRTLIGVLTVLISDCQDVFTAQSLSNCLYGLQGMEDEYKEVKLIVGVLAEKASLCTEAFNSQAVGNSIYGLKRMTLNNQSGRHMLRVLIPKVMRCATPMKAQEISNALYGLQRMESVYMVELLSLVRVLAKKLSQCKEPFTGQNISNLLYGLKSLSSTYSEVRLLVEEIARKVATYEGMLTPTEITMALLGLQNMMSKREEVRNLVGYLAKVIARSQDLLSSEDLQRIFDSPSLSGLKPNCSETLSLVQALVGCKHRNLLSDDWAKALFEYEGFDLH